MIDKISIIALILFALAVNTKNVVFYVFKIVELLIFIYSTKYIKKNKVWYWLFVNLAVYSMDIILLSSNLLLILIAWETLGICSWALIAMGSRKAAKRALTIILISDSFMIISMAYFFSNSIYNINEVKNIPKMVELFLLISFLGKSAQIPFSLWLLDAMEAPSTVSALLHSSTMVKAGVYLAYRFSISSNFCILFGYASALIASIFAIFERKTKKILAFSTIYNLGILFILLGLRKYDIFFYYMILHAYAKAGLFLFCPLLKRKDIYLSKFPKDVSRVILIPFFLFLSGIYPFGKEFLLEESFIYLPLIIFGTLYSVRFFSIIFSRKEALTKTRFEYKLPITVLAILLLFSVKIRIPRLYDVVPISLLVTWNFWKREFRYEFKLPEAEIKRVEKFDIQLSFLIYLLIAWVMVCLL